jgi:Trypsin-like peptidase domain
MYTVHVLWIGGIFYRMTTRRLRSADAISDVASTESSILPSPHMPNSPVRFLSPSSHSSMDVKIISVGSRLPDLTSTELDLLLRKQRQLSASAAITRASLDEIPHILNALASTLIFAQHEAGTAVCIDPRGWVLTCAHCFGESEEEWMDSKRKWLLFYTGLVVQVECKVWDSTRDLALAKVISIESNSGKPGDLPQFCFVSLSTSSPVRNGPIVCIGQPGRDDLESKSGNRRTNYDLIEISEGKFCGMIHGVDPQNNYEIGTLKHDAWTYWGHSGAPLLRRQDGTLIGLHSSWDDQTAMRHGIPFIAIEEFLRQHLPSVCDSGISSKSR